MTCRMMAALSACSLIVLAQPAETVSVPMRDGVRLATDVYLGVSGPRPVLLSRTPYNKAGLKSAAEFFRQADYAVVVQDCRGRFGSEGVYAPYRDDAADGEDTIAWIRKQPWCDGRIGMWGASHPGAVQWLAASKRPEGLRVIAPSATFTNPYQLAYQGGAFRLAFIAGAGIRIDPPPEREPPENIDRELRHLPISSLATVFGWHLPWLDSIVRHPNRHDSVWTKLDVSRILPTLQLAAQHVSGYYDLFVRDVVESFHDLRRNPANARNQRLILGPWSHQTLGKRKVGAIDFGPEAEVDLRSVDVEWFDAQLKDSDKPAQAAV
ncbi:MAG TPA: CocE/NonD family hydrolase, partial [Bryobacteraceae bacterium]|nr:CocE/NonD family hydrolase [Bryobacteraceae bacterium]